MLDVAAVARCYLLRHPKLLRQFSRWLSLDERFALPLLTLVIALHDLGKFAENFQNKREEIYRDNFGSDVPRYLHSPAHHDVVSGLIWNDEQFQTALGEALTLRLPKWQVRGDGSHWAPLFLASFAHHGFPLGSSNLMLDAHISSRAKGDAVEFMGWAVGFFLGDFRDHSSAPTESTLRIASWWLAGLAVLADWVGSNTLWFPYATPEQRRWPLARYWAEIACPQSHKALSEAGLDLVEAQSFNGVEALFPNLTVSALRPAQCKARDLELPSEPQLIVLEDATGSGKTEAALILAHRLMAQGLASGLFFGLPTQATADQMYERVDAVGPKLFADRSAATIVLAHGARGQDARFREKLAKAERDDVPDEEDTASLQLTQWLAQSNKRSLLAHVGIGTLDQAQFAALRVKHQPLRLLGLFDKVLIVDEVHAYDAYMQRVLHEVLKAHAAAGGSAILLSATLPLEVRQQLLDAFVAGTRMVPTAPPPRPALGQHAQRPPSPTLCSTDYPLLTHWAQGWQQPREIKIDAAAESHRDLRVAYLTDIDCVYATLQTAIDAAQCACWIRNTVGDATDAYRRAKAQLEGAEVMLFHSRFALIDRQKIQQKVLAHFGEKSDHVQRKRQVLIATQVVEQSLDVDFDCLVTDLAPIDLMLQRQGRLRRHARDRLGNRVDGADQRGERVLTVFGPDRAAVPEAAWYTRHSRGAAWVYAAHGRVWLSAKALGDRLDLPADFRRLVEEVYAPDTEIPECFDRDEDRNRGNEIAMTMTADMNVADWRHGYVRQGIWQDEERIGSRLGVQIELVLARIQNNALVPYARGGCKEYQNEWEMSAVRAPTYWGIGPESLPNDASHQHQIKALREQFPALKWRVIVPVVEGRAAMLDRAGKQIVLIYDPELGLALSNTKTPEAKS